MFCSFCGANIPDVSVFCSKCGQKLVGSTAASAAPAAGVDISTLENQGYEAYKRKDYAGSIAPWTQAAQMGSAYAQCCLGNNYYTGEGVAQDYAKAIEWFRKAAAQGDARAQYKLGHCYYNGEGVAKDNAKAAEWWGKAAAQGHKEAKENYDWIKAKMASAAAPAAPRTGPRRILIVADTSIGGQLGSILTSEGYEVAAHVYDGAQGVAKYKELHDTIDIVLMDISLPVMDGFTALDQILEFNGKAKVIMLKTPDQGNLVTKCLMRGASTYMGKDLVSDPARAKEVLEVISRVLPEEKKPVSAPAGGISRRMLIITDSMFIGKQLGTILSSEGHQVVDDIREIDQGIQKYAELYSGIDGVFLEIKYENRIEDIMKINRSARIISIIKADDNDAEKRCAFNGSAAYIHKPLDRKEVLACMSRILA